MPGFIPKKFPGKIAEPMIPFYAAGLVVLYAINAGANAMMNCKIRFLSGEAISPGSVRSRIRGVN
ncbi:F-type H+-transporting ATPase subunit J [Fonsecaea pedrosoi]|nr:F-type H+-transporting ATPase subunit J [Fonsecaea pedrosoi]